VKQAVYNFVGVEARGKGGSTPLHLACTRESSSVGRYPICVFPSLPAIALLLECGADPNSTDFVSYPRKMTANPMSSPPFQLCCNAVTHVVHVFVYTQKRAFIIDIPPPPFVRSFSNAPRRVVLPLKNVFLCLKGRVRLTYFFYSAEMFSN
jgi:hypothetical protein